MSRLRLTKKRSCSRWHGIRLGPYRHASGVLLLLLLPVLLGAVAGGDASQLPSNIAMEARLRAAFQATDWKVDPNKPALRAAYYTRLLGERALTGAQRGQVLLELAKEQLRAGEARKTLQSLDDLNHLGLPTPQAEADWHQLRAMAFLRLGEMENCAAMHGKHSCVFPLRTDGVHQLPEGARGAVEELQWVLQRQPGNALDRWLLNVAYMQLGQYPRAVPPRWLLPANLFASDADMGEFIDYAPLVGTDVMGHAGGMVVEDFDGDGLLDLAMTSSGPLDPMHLLRSRGNGTFVDVSEPAGVRHELGGLNLVSTDYDNDGRMDLLVLRGGWWGTSGNYPLSLLHNRGDGTFEDATERAGLLRLGPTQTAAWADYDNDGWLDLFVGYESTPGNTQPSVLLHNNHDGTFTAAGSLGTDAFVKGVAWGDFNNDGRPDLYVSVREGKNRLLRNDGPEDPAHPDPRHWRFTDVAAAAHVVPEGNTFATWFFDYDNDGWPDLFVAGYYTDSMQDVGRFEAGLPFHAGLPHLYRNNHDGTFAEVTHAAHLDRAILTMGSNFGDLDNDGWLDVYLGNGDPNYEALLPNRMFRNDGGRTFQDVTTSGGFGNLQKGHGVAFADIENRGHQDVLEKMGGAYVGDAYQSALYRNPGYPGRSVTLRLQGVESNRAAYGARIEAVFHEAARVRHVYRTVGAVSSFGGNPVQQQIGIGGADAIDELRIRWPAHPEREQVLRNVAAGSRLIVREGSASTSPMPGHSFTLGAAPLHSGHSM